MYLSPHSLKSAGWRCSFNHAQGNFGRSRSLKLSWIVHSTVLYVPGGGAPGKQSDDRLFGLVAVFSLTNMSEIHRCSPETLGSLHLPPEVHIKFSQEP